VTATLVATLTRPVMFGLPDRRNRTLNLITDTWQFPAGTEVYATERRDGTFTVRVPGTLWESHVYLSTLVPA